jgi:acetyl esterase/lipase
MPGAIVWFLSHPALTRRDAHNVTVIGESAGFIETA